MLVKNQLQLVSMIPAPFELRFGPRLKRWTRERVLYNVVTWGLNIKAQKRVKIAKKWTMYNHKVHILIKMASKGHEMSLKWG